MRGNKITKAARKKDKRLRRKQFKLSGVQLLYSNRPFYFQGKVI